MSLREEKKSGQRAAILDAAEALFRSGGYDETRIEDITSRVRISRQTFFNYFPSKDEVLRELGLRWLGRAIGKPRRRAPSADGVLADFRRALRAQARAIASDRDFMRLVYTRSGVILPQGRRVNDEERLALTHSGFEALAAIMRRAQQAGEIREDVDPIQVAEIYFGVHTVTIRLWLTDYWKTPGRLDTRLVRAFEILVDGLRPR